MVGCGAVNSFFYGLGVRGEGLGTSKEKKMRGTSDDCCWMVATENTNRRAWLDLKKYCEA